MNYDNILLSKKLLKCTKSFAKRLLRFFFSKSIKHIVPTYCSLLQKNQFNLCQFPIAKYNKLEGARGFARLLGMNYKKTTKHVFNKIFLTV